MEMIKIVTIIVKVKGVFIRIGCFFSVGDYRKTKIQNSCFSLVTCRVFHLLFFPINLVFNNRILGL